MKSTLRMLFATTVMVPLLCLAGDGYYTRFKHPRSAGGGTTVRIYEGNPNNCTDNEIASRHLSPGDEWLYNCGRPRTLCFTAQPDGQNEWSQKLGIGCASSSQPPKLL